MPLSAGDPLLPRIHDLRSVLALSRMWNCSVQGGNAGSTYDGMSRRQACWDCRNKELGAFLHSPLMDELRALEALSDAHRQGLPASPRAAAAAFHAAALPRFSAPGAGPQVRAEAAPRHSGESQNRLGGPSCASTRFQLLAARRTALVITGAPQLLQLRTCAAMSMRLLLAERDLSRAVACSKLEVRAVRRAGEGCTAAYPPFACGATAWCPDWN